MGEAAAESGIFDQGGSSGASHIIPILSHIQRRNYELRRIGGLA